MELTIKKLLIFIMVISGLTCSYCFGETEGNITVIGVGDIMPGTNYPLDYLPPNDGKNLFDHVKDILRDADVTFGNLEGTLLNTGKTVKSCSNPSLCYAFRIPERYINYLVDAGFDVLSLANNHVGDFGDRGRKKTVQILKKAGLNFAGLTNYPSATFEIKGVRYGFCAFAPNVGTVSIRNIRHAQKLVRKLKSKSDIVIVSFHGGAEGAAYRHVTRKTEIFYGENRGNVYQFAHKVIDAGADIVFGHGPHITRAVELYKGRFIAYSMGNFCTYGPFNLRGHNGVAPIIKLYLNNSGKFTEGKIYPFKQKKPGGPKPDRSNQAIKEIKALTRSDFPETNLIIQDQGELWVRD